MTVENSNEGSWLEAIALFQQARTGDHRAGMQLLETSADPTGVVHSLLRMLTVFLRGEETAKLDHFMDVSYRAGPPPPLAPRKPQERPAQEELVTRLHGRARLVEPMRDMLATQTPILTTVTRTGVPEVGPKWSMRAWNDHTLVYNEHAKGAHMANIRSGSTAVVTAIDQDTRVGYRFSGSPEVHEQGAVFDAAVDFATEQGLKRPVAGVLIRIHHIHTLTQGSGTGEPLE